MESGEEAVYLLLHAEPVAILPKRGPLVGIPLGGDGPAHDILEEEER